MRTTDAMAIAAALVALTSPAAPAAEALATIAVGIDAAEAALERRVRGLLAWVAEKNGYEARGVEVTLAFVAPEIINIVAFGTGYRGQLDAESVAIGASIILPDWFELGVNDDLLVHELTHVLQYTNEAEFGCYLEQEREAYGTQAAFTEATGIGQLPALWFVLFLPCDTTPWKVDMKK